MMEGCVGDSAEGANRLDLSQVPFSRFGSYLSVKWLGGEGAPDRGEGYYLRNHHGGYRPVMRIVPVVEGRPVAAETVAAGFTRLRWNIPDGGRIELMLTEEDGLRLRGRNAAVRLEPAGSAFVYSTVDSGVTFNLRSCLRRYQVECLRGRLELERRDPGKPHVNLDAVIHPDAEGEWEIAIDEFDSTWRPRERAPFDRCLAAVEEAFAAWLADVPEAPGEYAAARELAAYVNWSAVVHAGGLLRRPAMLMSKNWMTNVWSWDHCFNAVALARTRPDLALDQMLIMADHQDAFGCYPDAVNDVGKHYNYAKPPVHGLALRELLRRAGDGVDEDKLGALYDSLSRQFRWWMNDRRIEGQDLPYYLHGNDSGWDNSTLFDRGVPVTAPDLAAFLAAQAGVLAELAPRVGRGGEAAAWQSTSADLIDKLLRELWDGERFTARLALSGETVASDSLLYCMPIVLGKRLPREVLDRLVASIERFLTEWGLATEHPESDSYRPDGYWRGPIWAPSTCLIVWGLDAAGRAELANKVAERFCRMCAAAGFAENFNALTGEGLCDRAYTWTSSVFLLLAERLVERSAVLVGRKC